ncbi:MAG: DUF2963 domain-containing protein [Candidatus Phytoplasma sp. TWB_XP]
MTNKEIKRTYYNSDGTIDLIEKLN